MLRIIESMVGFNNTGKLRVNYDNSEYEIYKGEKIKILGMIDDEMAKKYVGLIGEADGPKKIGCIISVNNLRKYNNNWIWNNNVSLKRGDKILLIERNKEIIL